MIQLTLQRKSNGKDGLFGLLFYNGKTVHTLETSDFGGVGVVPIPAGVYKLETHNGPKYKNTVALVNHKLGIYHYPHSKAKRVAILIHAANVKFELRGCIALGEQIITNFDSVTKSPVKKLHRSKIAVRAFLDYFDAVKEAHNGEVYINILDIP